MQFCPNRVATPIFLSHVCGKSAMGLNELPGAETASLVRLGGKKFLKRFNFFSSSHAGSARESSAPRSGVRPNHLTKKQSGLPREGTSGTKYLPHSHN